VGAASPLVPKRLGGLKFAKFSNAYMLVYVRLADWGHIMAPVGKDALQEHLRKRLEVHCVLQRLCWVVRGRRGCMVGWLGASAHDASRAARPLRHAQRACAASHAHHTPAPHPRAAWQAEQADKERRQLEKQEAHLYCTVRVATDEDIAAQVRVERGAGGAGGCVRGAPACRLPCTALPVRASRCHPTLPHVHHPSNVHTHAHRSRSNARSNTRSNTMTDWQQPVVPPGGLQQAAPQQDLPRAQAHTVCRLQEAGVCFFCVMWRVSAGVRVRVRVCVLV
jgi:hypothetical protein